MHENIQGAFMLVKNFRKDNLEVCIFDTRRELGRQAANMSAKRLKKLYL
jgi:hypothetical protein